VIEDLVSDPPGPVEIGVRMVASALCRSDLHVVDGEWPRPPSVVMGHEGAGIVEELGPGVPVRAVGLPVEAGGFAVGDLVVLSWLAPCGVCRACRRGEDWLCATPRTSFSHRFEPELARLHRAGGSIVGVYDGIGTHATYSVVDAAAAYPIDPRTPHPVAGLIGCGASTGVGAVLNTAGVRTGESVVVIGLGGVGLSAVMGAALAGAHPIVAVDLSVEKRSFALTVGATHAVGGGPDADEAIRELTGGGADHAFEVIGLPTTVEQAVRVTRLGGTTTLVGMTPVDARAPLDVYSFVGEGKVIRGSNYGSIRPSVDFPRFAAFHLAGRLPLDRLITERIALDEINRGLADLRRGDGIRRVIDFEAPRLLTH
jgi:S-(hydroxymethyl)glutathione dehydrogenase/alcohol dehydrogenase